MSLVKSPVGTEENRSARGRNGRKSRGAATPEGKERARAANLRHGVYSKVRDEALTALGEDPAELAALVEGAYEQWRPANGFQANMVEELAHLQWRLQRAARMQEALTAEHVKKVEADRHEKATTVRYHYVDMEDFFALPGYIRGLTVAFAGEMKGGIVAILEALHRLQKPKNWAPATGPLPAEATNDQDWQQKLEELEEEGAGFKVPRPGLPVAEGEERDALREELRQLVGLELTALEREWKPYFDQHLKPMGPGERDQAAWECQRTLDLLRRQEDSCFRQFWRLTTLLMKIQDREGKRQDSGQDQGTRIQDSGSRSQDPGRGIQGSEAAISAGVVGRANAGSPQGVEAREDRPAASSRASIKNAGASGDVDENTGKGQAGATTSGPAPTAAAQRAMVPLTEDRTPKRILEAGLGCTDNARY